MPAAMRLWWKFSALTSLPAPPVAGLLLQAEEAATGSRSLWVSEVHPLLSKLPLLTYVPHCQRRHGYMVWQVLSSPPAPVP